MGKKKDGKRLTKTFQSAEPCPFDRSALRDGIIDIRPPYRESERIFRIASLADLSAIKAHVESCRREFVTDDHPDFAPFVPEGLEISYTPPVQITAPRLRVYYDDPEGVLRTLGVEVRQEARNGRVYQTLKVGHGGTAEDATLERFEQKSILHTWGFNPLAIGLDKTRDTILAQLRSMPQPVLAMASQRIRIEYHPCGDPDVRIELALEPVHYGRTCTGFVWETLKLELEIKKGPAEAQARRHLLDTEQERLTRHFPKALTPVYESSASPGFRALQESLHDPAQRAEVFRSLTNNPVWFCGFRRTPDFTDVPKP